MADDCELSSEVADRWLAAQIKATMEAQPSQPKDMFVPNGKCRWCKDPVNEGLSFCPSEPGESGCHDDWKSDQDRKKRAGRT